MIAAFRDHGHSIAQLDPLGIANTPAEAYPLDLLLPTYNFTEAQLNEPAGVRDDAGVLLDGVIGQKGYSVDTGKLTVAQLHRRLTEIYSSSMAIETVHCHPDHMRWIYDRLEKIEMPAFDEQKRIAMLTTLSEAHIFEETLSKKYLSSKRFGIEGGEALIVGLNEIIDRGSALGVTAVVMGMPHRGRLNVLANVATKPVEAILNEFKGTADHTFADEERLRVESDRAFEMCDLDGSGEITVGMLYNGLRRLGIDVTHDEAEDAFELADSSNSGALDADDFFTVSLRLLGRNYSGDVKYHLGITQLREFDDGRAVSLSLLPNPSHLEAVNPLVVGLARAKQLGIQEACARKAVMPLMLHGDAAFCAQGVVFETIGLSNLYGYTTGGALHVVLNNQIGFTTTPQESRSSRYCTDVAKAVGAPIIHVNGDDVEEVVRACILATDFRQEFGVDVVIDFVCYRRHGHQEADNPLFTQPRMYSTIKSHPSTLSIYSKRLVDEGVLTQEQSDDLQQERRNELQRKQELAKTYVPQLDDWLVDHGEPAERNDLNSHSFGQLVTGLDLPTLQSLNAQLSTLPEDLDPHRVVDALYKQRRQMLEKDSIDWALAEQLAWASCLVEGVHVRISGQDVERGTFSQRHAVVHDQKTYKTYLPLENINDYFGIPAKASFEIVNSSLSEFAVLGFELGYSLDRRQSLIMWEAQFGDFANTAQCIIDQFVSSAEAKWQMQSALVMLLPHGLEGSGPEHSSARLERFLQLCNDDPRKLEERQMQLMSHNWRVVNVTTPANYFHLLRLQVARPIRKPLIVMSPKQLLRHKRIRSPVDDFLPGTRFNRVIVDDPICGDPLEASRILFCSGRLWLDLITRREEEPEATKGIVLVRLEQIAPFPYDLVGETLERFRNAELVWAQEEPINAGAWAYVQPRIDMAAGRADADRFGAHGGPVGARTIRYVGRLPSSAPATGLYELHQIEQNNVIDNAMKS
jgi:2-oxoglutarate dehydrogenase E1 component